MPLKRPLSSRQQAGSTRKDRWTRRGTHARGALMVMFAVATIDASATTARGSRSQCCDGDAAMCDIGRMHAHDASSATSHAATMGKTSAIASPEKIALMNCLPRGHDEEAAHWHIWLNHVDRRWRAGLWNRVVPAESRAAALTRARR